MIEESRCPGCGGAGEAMWQGKLYAAIFYECEKCLALWMAPRPAISHEDVADVPLVVASWKRGA